MLPYKRSDGATFPDTKNEPPIVFEMETSSVLNDNPSSSANVVGSADTPQEQSPEIPSTLDAHFKLYLKTTTRQMTEKIQHNLYNITQKSMATQQIEYKENLIRLNALQSGLTDSLFENSLFRNNSGISNPEYSSGSHNLSSLSGANANRVATNEYSKWSTLVPVVQNENKKQTHSNDPPNVNPNMHYSSNHAGQNYSFGDNVQQRNFHDINENSSLIFGIQKNSSFANMLTANAASSRSAGYDYTAPPLIMSSFGAGTEKPSGQPFCTFCKRNNEPP